MRSAQVPFQHHPLPPACRFAFSFFGWFEIKLPDSWGNAVDNKASSTTGMISIFLMAFTLVLVSFSCTAPIIGLLLVQTVTSGDWLAPTVGMFGLRLLWRSHSPSSPSSHHG